MNDLTISLCTVDRTLGKMVLEPVYDLDRGKAWHGTIKVGDSTIGVYASLLPDNAPVDKEEYPKSIG